MKRRTFLKNSTAIASSLPIAAMGDFKLRSSSKKMGIAIATYAARWYAKPDSKNYTPFNDALQVLEHCHQLGAGGLQIGVKDWSSAFAKKVRDKREKLDLYIEGQISLPKKDSEIARFESELKSAKEAGATLLRAVCLSGRRYENFKSAESFQQFKADSIEALQRAEPLLRKHQLRLAVENHKDWRAAEFVSILKQLDSPWIGITLDTGNNISLLENPMHVVELLAPYTFSIHFKDCAFKEYEDGFLLSEVPLGQGALDLKKMIAICEQHNADVNFNLEMITRNPLKVPCLREDYWATFDQLPGKQLANTLAMVRRFDDKDQQLPEIESLNSEQRLKFEEENVVRSFEFAKGELGFA